MKTQFVVKLQLVQNDLGENVGVKATSKCGRFLKFFGWNEVAEKYMAGHTIRHYYAYVTRDGILRIDTENPRMQLRLHV